MSRFQVIAFDADDTLWHNERLYAEVQSGFRRLLARYHSSEWVDVRLHQTEMRNLLHFGYGIKGFALSMIETAIELTDGRITGAEVQSIIDSAKRMLAADVDLLDHADETLTTLAADYPLMLITKGDLHDQEAKISRSGIADRFRHVEIVSDKSTESYRALLERHRIAPDRFLMVGNSLRSDILPVLALGATAVYVPYELTWAHEAAERPPAGRSGYYELEHIGGLPELIRGLERGGQYA
jgi:putative hydrolase of the HAD superfamily